MKNRDLSMTATTDTMKRTLDKNLTSFWTTSYREFDPEEFDPSIDRTLAKQNSLASWRISRWAESEHRKI
jgi:hypothetical protein